MKNKQKTKKPFLILQFRTLKKYRTTTGLQGLASSEQARRATDRRRERRWEMVDQQHQQVEGKL